MTRLAELADPGVGTANSMQHAKQGTAEEQVPEQYWFDAVSQTWISPEQWLYRYEFDTGSQSWISKDGYDITSPVILPMHCPSSTREA